MSLPLPPAAAPQHHAKEPSLPSLGEPDLLAVPFGFCLRRFVEHAPAPPLPPVVFDAEKRALQFVVYPETDAGKSASAEALAVEILVCQAAPGKPLLVYGLPPEKKTSRRKGAAGEGSIRGALQAQVEAVLGVDEDLSLFHAMCQNDAQLRWAPDVEAGRSLRAPRVFEDLLKTLLRARLPVSQQAAVCARLCSQFGPPTTLSRRGFPTAEALAKTTPAQLAKKLGIAAPLAKSLCALVQTCADGRFYPDSLRRLPSGFAQLLSDAEDDADAEAAVLTAVDAELEWQVRVSGFIARLPGFGERSRTLLHPLVGCHGEPALDIDSLRAWQGRTARGRSTKVSLRARTPEADTVAQNIVNRVGRYAIYAGLAQRLLLQGPPSV
jgi:hypothetical protein